ncbi:MAG: NfeD family protein [Planctomycetaceae bacterium]
MPDAGVLATILLIVGLFLLALELMIPSFGMIGIMSAVCLLISAWAAWQAWWGTSPGFFWTYAGFWVLGIPSVLGGVLFLLQNTSLGDRVVLKTPPVLGNSLLHQEQQRLANLIGRIGTAGSLLTPGGMVVIDGERFHAESQGMVIDPGQPVRVVAVKSSRLVVAPATDEDLRKEESRRQQQIDTSTTVADMPDFEIPET